jgi:hypothetical protein
LDFCNIFVKLLQNCKLLCQLLFIFCCQLLFDNLPTFVPAFVNKGAWFKYTRTFSSATMNFRVKVSIARVPRASVRGLRGVTRHAMIEAPVLLVPTSPMGTTATEFVFCCKKF